MAGITGRSTAAAWARSSTWSVAASVTRQILLTTSEGIEDMPTLVTDDAFNQTFVGTGEVGDRNPPTPDVQAQLRYEQIDSLLAMACGSVAAPVVVSSAGANSLVAYKHVITLAPELTHFLTLAIDLNRYVSELRTARLRGISLKVGDGGRISVSFPSVADRVVYDSTVNTSSTVWGAAQAIIGHRVMRKDGVFRMNLASAGSLGASDVISQLKEFTFDYQRPLAQDDHVVGLDTIIEPDDDGFLDASLGLTFPRMTTLSANSMAQAFAGGAILKGDLTFTGAYVNSTTRRSIAFEFPAGQVSDFKASVTGASEIRPTAKLSLYQASEAPTGMSGLTAPFRITIINANSANLLA
jgi:hypothetical protein